MVKDSEPRALAFGCSELVVTRTVFFVSTPGKILGLQCVLKNLRWEQEEVYLYDDSHSV